MSAHDGWIVRVRPYCASISAAQWMVLADLALSNAHPHIELTRLGNVQLRGVREADLCLVRSQLIDAHLAPADADADLAPPVHCTPFYRSGDATHALAVLLSEAAVESLSPKSLRSRGADALPSKFGLLVDDSRRCLREIPADLHVWVAEGGGYGLALGDSADWFSFEHAEDAVAAVVEVAQWFARERMAIAPAPTRLQGLLPHRKPDVGRLKSAASRAATSGAAEPVEPIEPGLHPSQAWVIGAPFGRIDAMALRKVAIHLPAHTEIRVTPWRSVLLDAKAAESRISLWDCAHWITRPDDARWRISACAGAPRCTQGLVDAQGLARQLASQVPEKGHLHVSGCAKCCALPAQATSVIFAAVADAESRGACHAAVPGPVMLKACLPSQRGNPSLQISPQALNDEPGQIQKILHELHVRNAR
jgi:precorrin-3B synthase